MTDRNRQSGGFSIAEVVVALGLLAGVVISLVGMLVLGNRLVQRGRGSSEALAVARDIIEETGGWTFRQTYSAFEDCEDSDLDCEVDTRDDAAASAWQARLRETLEDTSYAMISIQPLEPVSLGQADVIRVTVTVFWQEMERQRSVRLVTVRM